jgi:hypothetical protein
MFNLPKSTIVNRIVPKKAFDEYTNSKQKQLFTDKISKVRWLHKLSPKTINLSGNEVKEIEIFEVILKVKDSIPDLLKIIDKAIPYHILFVLKFEDLVMFLTAQKHIHPTNENQAVVDWSFSTDWIDKIEFDYHLNLKQSLDFVFEDICFQITGESKNVEDISTLISKEQKRKHLEKRIEKLKSEIKRCKQFNTKVELNRELLGCEKELIQLNECRG